MTEDATSSGKPRITEDATSSADVPASSSGRPQTTEVSEKIKGIVNGKGVSLKHLRDIANQLAQDGEHISKKKMDDIAHARFNAVRRSISLPLAQGGEHMWHVADPSMLVAASVRSSETLQDMFAKALQLHPGTPEAPWKLLITWDEFVPGSMLKPNNTRKAMVVNLSFQELGSALHNDRSWWTIAVAKSSILKQVVGGWSRMLRDLLKLVLLSPTGMETVGIPLQLKGDFVSIHCKVGCLLSDGDGLRLALQWMGSSSLHPCFRHWNVLKKGSARAEHCDRYVEIDCHCASRFQTWSNVELAEAIDVCVDAEQQRALGHLTSKRLQETQTHLGFRATQHGLLSDPLLRRHIDFMRVLRYDWAHTFLADGAVGSDMWQLVEASERHSLFSQATIQEFLQEDWIFPRASQHKQRGLWKLFNESGRKTNEEHKSIKASMGELLGLYGLMRHFVEARCTTDNRVDAELRIFHLSCKAVDMILVAKRNLLPLREVGEKLMPLLEQQLRLRVQTLGNARVKPKHHWCFDIAQCMLQGDPMLLDTFGTERLHLRVKHIAENCRYLHAYEDYVMAGVTNVHMNSLEFPGGGSPVHLVGKQSRMPGAPNILLASGCQCHGEHFHVGDFCFRGSSGLWVVCVRVGVGDGGMGRMIMLWLMSPGAEVGLIVACCEDENLHFLIVDKPTLLATLSQHSSRWNTMAASRDVWRSSEVINCMAWKIEHGEATTITF